MSMKTQKIKTHTQNQAMQHRKTDTALPAVFVKIKLYYRNRTFGN